MEQGAAEARRLAMPLGAWAPVALGRLLLQRETIRLKQGHCNGRGGDAPAGAHMFREKVMATWELERGFKNCAVAASAPMN